MPVRESRMLEEVAKHGRVHRNGMLNVAWMIQWAFDESSGTVQSSTDYFRSASLQKIKQSPLKR
jgi:hypothetical protein